MTRQAYVRPPINTATKYSEFIPLTESFYMIWSGVIHLKEMATSRSYLDMEHTGCTRGNHNKTPVCESLIGWIVISFLSNPSFISEILRKILTLIMDQEMSEVTGSFHSVWWQLLTNEVPLALTDHNLVLIQEFWRDDRSAKIGRYNEAWSILEESFVHHFQEMLIQIGLHSHQFRMDHHQG